MCAFGHWAFDELIPGGCPVCGICDGMSIQPDHGAAWTITCIMTEVSLTGIMPQEHHLSR